MCGITGIINRDGDLASIAILERMTDSLTHRGPDDAGIYTCAGVGIGHRRLSVVDPLGDATQPMQRAGSSQVLSFTGEIYNHLDLRKTLESEGVQFTSKSDTEVVYHSLRQWGGKSLPMFNGMLALSWLDGGQSEVILARDRFGIKPLYYADLGNVFIYGSEVKAILAHPNYRTSLNTIALTEYLAFQNVFGESTLFKNIYMVPPGSFIRVPIDRKKNISIHNYHDHSLQAEKSEMSLSESVEQLDVLLRASITRQVAGDEPPSAYLSGGVDSAVIASLACEISPNINTINIGFDMSQAEAFEQDMDEHETASEIAEILGTNHHLEMLSENDVNRSLRDIVWHLEDIKMGQSYSNFSAAKIARKYGKTVLSGLGADELLGGYPWRYGAALNCQNDDDFLDGLHNFWHGLTTRSERKQLLAPLWSQVKHVDTRSIVSGVVGDLPEGSRHPEDYFKIWRQFELKTFLPGLLAVEDKLGMAHGVETRFPMLDNELVDFALCLPVAHMVPIDRTGKSNEHLQIGNNQGKKLLRQVMKRYLPAPFAERRKRGFTGPNNSWYRVNGGAYLKTELLDRNAPLYAFIDFGTARTLVERHLSGHDNRHRLIWSLLSLNQWCKTFL